jgi:hypothetical protein
MMEYIYLLTVVTWFIVAYLLYLWDKDKNGGKYEMGIMLFGIVGSPFAPILLAIFIVGFPVKLLLEKFYDNFLK